jgi:hypothetical protein
MSQKYINASCRYFNCHNPECHYAECHLAECHGATLATKDRLWKGKNQFLKPMAQ